MEKLLKQHRLLGRIIDWAGTWTTLWLVVGPTITGVLAKVAKAPAYAIVVTALLTFTAVLGISALVRFHALLNEQTNQERRSEKRSRPTDDYAVEQARKFEERAAKHQQEAIALATELAETKERLAKADANASVSLKRYTEMVGHAVRLAEQREAAEITIRRVYELLLPRNRNPVEKALADLSDDPADEMRDVSRLIDAALDAQVVLLQHRQATLSKTPLLEDRIQESAPRKIPSVGTQTDDPNRRYRSIVPLSPENQTGDD